MMPVKRSKIRWGYGS